MRGFISSFCPLRQGGVLMRMPRLPHIESIHSVVGRECVVYMVVQAPVCKHVEQHSALSLGTSYPVAYYCAVAVIVRLSCGLVCNASVVSVTQVLGCGCVCVCGGGGVVYLVAT